MKLLDFLREFEAERAHVENGAHSDVDVVLMDPMGCHESPEFNVNFVHSITEAGKLVRIELHAIDWKG